MKRAATILLFAALLAGPCDSASAQNIPAGQSCGGLLCDVGILGHKTTQGPDGAPVAVADPTALPCSDFLCRAFGQRTAQAAPPPPVAAPEPMPEPEKPMKRVKKLRKHVAKAEAAPATPAPADAK